ncbi:MAG TPA: hypothetical protein VNT79_02955 [Phycisphaerae bacterium]|nr:hypothetical protein [Phycisphaerae bacterium]
MRPQTLKTRGIHVGVRFAPPAAMDKRQKQTFQRRANEGFDWQRQEFSQNVWRLLSPQSDGDRRSSLKFSVQRDGFNFEDAFPTSAPDVFFDNLRMAMDVVGDVFDPKVMVGTGAVIRMTAQSDPDDARLFLAGKCLKLDDRLVPLGRPIHGVGLSMLLPPLPGEGQPNWQATVKIETLIEDVRQLFIEVDARWGVPAAWDAKTVIDRVQIAQDFTTHQVSAFLVKLGQPET